MNDDSSQLTYSDGEDDIRGERNSRRYAQHDEDSYGRHDEDSHAHNAEDDEEGEDDDSYEVEDASVQADTIALFGAYGPTGHHFLRLALEAGYRVRALVTPGIKLDHHEQFGSHLYTVTGQLNDAAKVQEVVYGSAYVVCMVGETLLAHQNPKKKKDYKKDTLLDFVKLLYPIMTRQDDPVISGFLFQATALAANAKGKTPMFSQFVKTLNRKRSLFLQDQDAVIHFIDSQHRTKQRNSSNSSSDGQENPPARRALFSYIVTRPGVLRDGPSTKKLAASKSVSAHGLLLLALFCHQVLLKLFSLTLIWSLATGPFSFQSRRFGRIFP